MNSNGLTPILPALYYLLKPLDVPGIYCHRHPRGAIYISHRLSSCRFCNDIAVFHEGRLVQRGSAGSAFANGVEVNSNLYVGWLRNFRKVPLHFGVVTDIMNNMIILISYT